MSVPTRPESALRKEWRLFREGSTRLWNAYLNAMFDLSPKASNGRFWAFVVIFFFTGFLLSLINYPLTLWLTRLQDIFLYFFNAAYRASYTAGNPLSNLALFALQVFLDPRNLRFLPLLLAPYFISLQSAAIYLADIFNFDEVGIARKHILEVALGGSDETLHIAKGEIADDHKKSANYLIGGPGKVLVELDSAAVFEKPDGTPRVIGPTGKEPGGKATIEGFERFREAIDLRDHFVEVRNGGGERADNAPSISSRSKDGVPISATDVRFMYSVERGDTKPTGKDGSPPADLPYPFTKQAVENIVYHAASTVTPDQKDPSAYAFSLVVKESMLTVVRSELVKFINQNELNKYFASIGQPEVDRVAQRENLLSDEVQKLLPLGMTPPEKKEPPKKPAFVPRPQIKTDLFSEFADSFNKHANERGVRLHWIGIGTWKSPVEKVFGKHIEAWKLNRENVNMDSNESYKKAGTETNLQKIGDLIRDIPLGSFEQAKAEHASVTAVMRTMLVDYKKQLTQARDLWSAKGEMVPVDVEDAIAIIRRVLGFVTPGTDNPTFGGSLPPDNAPDSDATPPDAPPDSDTPQTDDSSDPQKGGGPDMPGFTYADLIGMVNGDGAMANQLIERERDQFPNESQESLIARAIDRLLQNRR